MAQGRQPPVSSLNMFKGPQKICDETGYDHRTDNRCKNDRQTDIGNQCIAGPGGGPAMKERVLEGES